MAKTGRPSLYTQELGDEICERLMDGESLRGICLDEDKPSRATVCRWLASNDMFRDQYARAREFQADTLADEIQAIADEEGENVKRSRLRVDARKWLASKLQPKRYGDKLELGGSLNIGSVLDGLSDP